MGFLKKGKKAVSRGILQLNCGLQGLGGRPEELPEAGGFVLCFRAYNSTPFPGNSTRNSISDLPESCQETQNEHLKWEQTLLICSRSSSEYLWLVNFNCFSQKQLSGYS